jgi:hypothetical protein
VIRHGGDTQKSAVFGAALLDFRVGFRERYHRKKRGNGVFYLFATLNLYRRPCPPVEQLDTQDGLVGGPSDFFDQAQIAMREALERRDPGAIRLGREQGELDIRLQNDAFG